MLEFWQGSWLKATLVQLNCLIVVVVCLTLLCVTRFVALVFWTATPRSHCSIGVNKIVSETEEDSGSKFHLQLLQ